MTLKETLMIWTLPILITLLVLASLGVMGYDLYIDYKFMKENGVSQPELKCKTFCDPLPYYFDIGGLFANDICECKYGGVEE